MVNYSVAMVSNLVPVVSHLVTLGNEVVLLVNSGGAFGQFGRRCVVKSVDAGGQRSGFS